MTEPMKTAKDIMYKTFGVSNKLDMMKTQFIGLADQGKIVVAMTEYAAQQVSAERERIKNAIHELPVSRVGFSDWEYLVKEDILKLIDSL